MFQTMAACTNFIFSLKASQYKGEPLVAAKKLLAYFGNPQEDLRYVHFAGSNGKGSTLNATREILMAHGLKVGAFISPHFIVPNERVTINKEMITDIEFLALMNDIEAAIQSELDGKYPSFFEMMTVMAFLYFAKMAPDVVLLETGLGGRIDTTNIITPEVSVITTISLEHTQLLGDTYEKVAYEKAGIIKSKVPVVVGVKQLEALKVIKEVATLKEAPTFIIGENITVSYEHQSFSYHSDRSSFESLQLRMQGVHQMDNAALAVTAALLFDESISETTIRHALKCAAWEGRFERIANNIVLDGAHNLEGTIALVDTLQRVEPNKQYTFLYAVMDDKDHKRSIEVLSQVAKEMVFTELSIPRAAKAVHLFNECSHGNKKIAVDWQLWLKSINHAQNEDELFIVTGSLYFIAEVRKALEGLQ